MTAELPVKYANILVDHTTEYNSSSILAPRCFKILSGNLYGKLCFIKKKFNKRENLDESEKYSPFTKSSDCAIRNRTETSRTIIQRTGNSRIHKSNLKYIKIKISNDIPIYYRIINLKFIYLPYTL